MAIGHKVFEIMIGQSCNLNTSALKVVALPPALLFEIIRYSVHSLARIICHTDVAFSVEYWAVGCNIYPPQAWFLTMIQALE